MKLIAHRGNTDGPNLSKENSPDYIQHAIDKGFDAEIDLWVVNSSLFLGHDEPQYPIDVEWLINRSDRLWIHCKSVEAAVWISSFANTLNYFWHETDLMTLTSKGYWWVFPGKQPVVGSIAVMPEIYKDDVSQCQGICSDYLSHLFY